MCCYNASGTLRRHARFFPKLLKKQGVVPLVIVTDKLLSYEAAKKQVMKNMEHRYS